MQAHSLKGKKSGGQKKRDKRTLLLRAKTKRRLEASSKALIGESLSEALGEPRPLSPFPGPSCLVPELPLLFCCRCRARVRLPTHRALSRSLNSLVPPPAQPPVRTPSLPLTLPSALSSLPALRGTRLAGAPQETPPGGHFWSGVRQFVQIDLRDDPKPDDAAKKKAKDDAVLAAAAAARSKARCIIQPGSSWKTKWDLTLGCLVLFSIMIVPYRISFGIEVRPPRCARGRSCLLAVTTTGGVRSAAAVVDLTLTHPRPLPTWRSSAPKNGYVGRRETT